MFQVHPHVVRLFLSLLQPRENSQLYTNCADEWTPRGGLSELEKYKVLLTGLCKHGSTQIEAEEKSATRYRLLRTDTPEFYQDPTDLFHLGFGMPPVTIDQQPIPVQDKLMIWKASEHDARRMGSAHLITMEGLLYATSCSGYFGVVVPSKWIGKQMTFRRWWQDHAAAVARIRLPEGAVHWSWRETGIAPVSFELPAGLIDQTKEGPPDHESLAVKSYKELPWDLCIFHRPTVFGHNTSRTQPLQKLMPFAEYRYTPFLFPLENLDNESIDSCADKFRKHDWWRNSVKLWREMVEQNEHNSTIGTPRSSAHGMSEQKSFWMFNPSEESQHRIIQVEKKDDIKGRNAVQIIFGSTVKLSPKSTQATGVLLDMKAVKGMETNEDGEMEFALDRLIYRKPFSEVRDQIVAELYELGLVPYMTKNDYHRMKKKERWLSIQLTPKERMVHVGAHSEEEQLADPMNWEMMYEDVGMKATFPELWDLWMRRAKWMKIDRFTKPFQLEDIVYTAIKQSILNANVPGLGKTRISLFASILRCAKKVLIVAPMRLIGTWQDEIRDCIVPYARLQKVNWQGQVIDPTLNIIEWGRDLSEDNLATFNIISLDKLKQTPRDGKFYRCPKCQTVVYSLNASSAIPCPGDPNVEDEMKRCSHAVKAWHADNVEAGAKKHRVLLGADGNPMLKVAGTKYPMAKAWAKAFPEEPVPESFPLERIVVQDDRPPKPQIPICEPVDNMFKKMKKIQIGWEENKTTGEKKPLYKWIDRPFHCKWTFSELVRNRFPFVIADELHYIANETSKRNQAVEHVNGTTRIGLTGTPMKGYPEKMLPLLNWVLDRDTFPDYRDYDPEGMARFRKKYELVVNIGGTELADGTMTGGEKKRLPKINNVELFQSEMSSLMIRRTRNEPPVTKDVPPYKIVRERIEVMMDEEHKAYYNRWLQVFAEWWAEMKRDKEGKNVESGQILTKLTYLSNASFIPHYMLDNILEGKDDEGKKWAQMIKQYKGPPVAKMKKAWSLIKEAVKMNEKTLVFSYRQKNSDFGHYWCTKNGINSMVVDGRIPLDTKKGQDRSERHLAVERFRNNQYHVMWAGTDALAEGMNIHEANHGIVLDYWWEDAKIRQAIGRMLRIQQQRTVYANHLLHKGAIDGYMAALSELKARSADEAIDFMQFDDFHVDMIPDIRAYADAIVDGTTDVIVRKMWTAIDFMTKKEEEEGDYGQGSS